MGGPREAALMERGGGGGEGRGKGEEGGRGKQKEMTTFHEYACI